jgi:hypothetical protein
MSGSVERFSGAIVIVAAPRSGSTLLFSAMSTHPALWSLYRESNDLLEGPFDPRRSGATSNELNADALDESTATALRAAFFERAGNVERIPLGRFVPIRGRGRARVAHTIAWLSRPWKRPPIRLVEKSPKNSLRVPFMRALFPGARFVHLVRDPRTNVASLVRAWSRQDRHKTYPLPPGFRIEGYAHDRWSFVLQPGWRALDGRSLVEVCVDQWRACNEACLRDLDAGAFRVRYEDLIADPGGVFDAVATWADLDPGPFDRFRRRLPVVQTKTPPDPGKWLSLKDEVERALPGAADVAAALGYA